MIKRLIIAWKYLFILEQRNCSPILICFAPVQFSSLYVRPGNSILFFRLSMILNYTYMMFHNSSWSVMSVLRYFFSEKTGFLKTCLSQICQFLSALRAKLLYILRLFYILKFLSIFIDHKTKADTTQKYIFIHNFERFQWVYKVQKLDFRF